MFVSWLVSPHFPTALGVAVLPTCLLNQLLDGTENGLWIVWVLE